MAIFNSYVKLPEDGAYWSKLDVLMFMKGVHMSKYTDFAIHGLCIKLYT